MNSTESDLFIVTAADDRKNADQWPSSRNQQRNSNIRAKSATASTRQVRIKLDPMVAPVQNPNFHKSQQVIDAQIGEDKARITKANKQFERRFERNFNKWREYDLLTCLIAIVGLALAIVDWEYTRVAANNIVAQKGWCSGTFAPDCTYNTEQVRLTLSKSNFVRVVIVIVSIFGVITLWVRHVAKARWLNEDLPVELLNNHYFNIEGGSRDVIEAEGFKQRVWFQKSFWFEALIFLICPVPFKDWSITIHPISIASRGETLTVYYLVSDFILVVMFLRLYFVVRAVFNYNMYMDIFAKKLCRGYGFTANVRFTFKALLKTDPALTVSVLMLVSVLVLAYCMRVFEVQYY